MDFSGTNGPDVFYTRPLTLETNADGDVFEISDGYYGYGGDDAFRIRVSNVDVPGLFETSSDIQGNEGNDSLVFAPARDYLGQVDINVSGGSGSDSVKLDLSKLGSAGIDFTDINGGGFTTIITLLHADGISAGQFFLRDDIERIEILGTSAADVLIGNRGNDHLDGGSGADLFYKTRGSDQYVFDDAGDRVALFDGSIATVPADGSDTIWAWVSVDLRDQYGVENLRLGADGTEGTGNDAANLITGSSGRNTIAGGGGNDSLYGKGGADTFSFAEKGAANRDSIWNFNDDDRIELSQATFAGLDKDRDGLLDLDALSQTGKALGGVAQLIYNKATGILSYDADGVGAGAAEDIAFIGRMLGFLDPSDVILTA
ncbi:hypothetical protein ACLNGM_07950 [Aureimonas phyllosphaerae]|uniref:hypothetical protein n=1 Tax=Aureimonas phyllosphaerae TaxID=1166078 RepID=UPI003A5C67E3